MKTFLMEPVVWLALILSGLLSFAGGNVVGHRQANQAADLRESKAALAARERLGAETEKVRALEKARIKDVGDLAIKHQLELNDAKTKIDSLRADVRSGAVRLSIATRPANNCAAGGNPAAAGGAAEETRSELVPAAADALIGIAADGDDAVRDFNACHDAYEAVRGSAARQGGG